MSLWDYGHNVPRTPKKKVKKARPLSDYSEKELREEIRKKTHARLVHLVENVDDYIRRSVDIDVQSMVAAVLGFRYSFDRWEVDHCNGRQSPLTDLIKGRAGKIVSEKLDDFIEKWEPTQKMKKDLQRAIKEEFHEVYAREVRASVRSTIKEHARALVARDVNEYLLKMDEERLEEEKSDEELRKRRGC